MDDRSDDDLEYRSRYRKLDFSDSPLSISDEEDNGDLLEIKPPQARVRKHGRRHSKHREVYVGSSSRHKEHHSRRHQEERHLKERLEGEPKSRTFSKDSEIDRVKEYEEYRRKKYAHHRREEKPTKEERYRYEDEPRIEERYKELDLREKLERRKIRHQQKEYERNERKEKERKRHAKTAEKELYEDEPEIKKRRHEAESRRREKTPEKEKSRHSKKSRTASQDVSPVRKGMIVDVEMSPPVLKNEYDVYSKNVRDEEEGEVESDEDGSSNSSTDSDSEDTETSSSSSSSSGSSQTEVEDREDDKSVKNEDSKDGSKAESASLITNAGGEVDNEIELEKDTLPAYFPAIQGCRSVEEFQCLNRIEEGTYGVVYRAREKKTDKIVALKRLKMEKEKDGFPITSLREINTLLKAQHPNIVTVKEIVVGSNMDKIFIVMDYIEHDLKSLMETMKQKKTSFMSSEVKCLMQQLLKAVNHLHDNWILHRDLKTSNLLFSHTGVLKVGDFGLAREYGSPLKHYTPVVVTLWYRAPELLLGTKEYSTCVDMWSVGCIFAELLNMEPLFPGKTEIDQLNRIFKALGTPNERIWPEFFTFPVTQRVTFTEYPANGIRSKFVPSVLTETGYDLLTSFLTYNTKTRITADTALKHKYFSESPLPIEPAMFPTWPAKSEPGYRKAIASSPKPPSGGQGYKNLGEDDGFYIPVGERNPRGFNLQSTFSLRF